MRTLKFKSTIKCMGCVAQVKPFLDQAGGIIKWDVDISAPSKTLSIETETMKADEISSLLEKAGYKIEYLPTESEETST